MPGRYGGVICSKSNCWESAVKPEELDSPLRGRILYMEVDGIIIHACIKKTAGISWRFHISHRDLMAASGRNECLRK